MTAYKIEYNQLEVGQEFPAVNFELDPGQVAAYLQATGETDNLYAGTGSVPPTAVAAWALISLLEYIDLPDGTIHLSQDVQSMGVAKKGMRLSCFAKVSRKQERGRLRLLDIGFDIQNDEGIPLMLGKSSFNFP